MKVETLIKMSLGDIGKGAAEQDIQPSTEGDAITTLNMIMFERAELNLGFTEVKTAGDELTTPNWSWMWMRNILAYVMARQFGILSEFPLVIKDEKESYRRLLNKVGEIPGAQLTGNTPRGSGNRGYNYLPPYYSEVDDDVLTEGGATIVTEGI